MPYNGKNIEDFHQETNALQAAIGKFDNADIAIKAFTITFFIAGLGLAIKLYSQILPDIGSKSIYNWSYLLPFFGPSVLLAVLFFIIIAWHLESRYNYYRTKFRLRMSLITNYINNAWCDIEEVCGNYTDLGKLKDLLKLYNPNTELKRILEGQILPRLDISLKEFFKQIGLSDKNQKELKEQIRKKYIYPELNCTFYWYLIGLNVLCLIGSIILSCNFCY